MYKVWLWTKLGRKYTSIPGASYKMKRIKIRTDFARAVRASVKRKNNGLTWKIFTVVENKNRNKMWKLNKKINIWNCLSNSRD